MKPMIQKPLHALTAADLMTRDLVLISEHLSLQSAARLLADAGVSGAPVIDSAGVCVGVLSGTDFVRWAREGGRQEPALEAKASVCADWQVVESDGLPVAEVRSLMTGDPVTAPEAMGVQSLARQMLEAHIHRVVIVDELNRPVGIVSATDILSAVACSETEESTALSDSLR